jgi:hypothetical protein
VHREQGKGMQEECCAGSDHQQGDKDNGQAGAAPVEPPPAGDEPRDEARDNARSEDEEKDRPDPRACKRA